jgi:hypothetical protein
MMTSDGGFGKGLRKQFMFEGNYKNLNHGEVLLSHGVLSKVTTNYQRLVNQPERCTLFYQ